MLVFTSHKPSEDLKYVSFMDYFMVGKLEAAKYSHFAFHKIKYCWFWVSFKKESYSSLAMGNTDWKGTSGLITHTLNTRHGTNDHCAYLAGHSWCVSACICVCAVVISTGDNESPCRARERSEIQGSDCRLSQLAHHYSWHNSSRFLSPSLTPFLHLLLRSVSLWLSVLLCS